MGTLQVAVLAIGFVLAASPAYAKRLPPKPVPPVSANGIEFSAPHDVLMGLVVATDIKSGAVIWRRQVYSVKIDPSLEEDIQWCFITSIKVEHGNLVVNNERGYIYRINLRTLQVYSIKGSLVIRRGIK